MRKSHESQSYEITKSYYLEEKKNAYNEIDRAQLEVLKRINDEIIELVDIKR